MVKGVYFCGEQVCKQDSRNVLGCREAWMAFGGLRKAVVGGGVC